jgi:hypothetical protein
MYIKTKEIILTRGHTSKKSNKISQHIWLSWADIQRRGSRLAWIVILSVYGADTIAIDLSLSELNSLFIKSIIGFKF